MNLELDWRETAVNATLVVLSVAVVLAGVEVALATGLVGSNQPYPKVQRCWGADERKSFHHEYGWINSPDTRLLIRETVEQDWTTYTYNEHGFRDTFDSGDGPAVIALGDSFTEGKMASDNATMPHLLDRWTPDRPVKNYGVGGYGTGQALLVYRDVGDEVEHDVVVLFFFLGNDMLDNVDDDPKRPRFERSETGVDLVHEPRNETAADPHEPNPGMAVQSRWLRGVIRFLQEHTRTYPYFEPRLRSVLLGAGVLDPPRPPGGEALDRQLGITRALLEALARETQRNGAELVVVSIPERGDVRPGRPHQFLPAQGRPYWQAQRELLRDFAESRDSVMYLPMRADLERGIDEGSRLYGIHDAHLIDAGYRVTAKRVYEHLVTTGRIRDAEPGFSRNYTAARSSC